MDRQHSNNLFYKKDMNAMDCMICGTEIVKSYKDPGAIQQIYAHFASHSGTAPRLRYHLLREGVARKKSRASENRVHEHDAQQDSDLSFQLQESVITCNYQYLGPSSSRREGQVANSGNQVQISEEVGMGTDSSQWWTEVVVKTEPHYERIEENENIELTMDIFIKNESNDHKEHDLNDFSDLQAIPVQFKELPDTEHVEQKIEIVDCDAFQKGPMAEIDENEVGDERFSKDICDERTSEEDGNEPYATEECKLPKEQQSRQEHPKAVEFSNVVVNSATRILRYGKIVDLISVSSSMGEDNISVDCQTDDRVNQSLATYQKGRKGQLSDAETATSKPVSPLNVLGHRVPLPKSSRNLRVNGVMQSTLNQSAVTARVFKPKPVSQRRVLENNSSVLKEKDNGYKTIDLKSTLATKMKADSQVGTNGVAVGKAGDGDVAGIKGVEPEYSRATGKRLSNKVRTVKFMEDCLLDSRSGKPKRDRSTLNNRILYQYKCGICPFAGTTKLHLDKHKLINHKEHIMHKESLACDWCAKISMNRRRLQMHIKKHHPMFYCGASKLVGKAICWSCEKCNYGTGRKSNLIRHMRIHLESSFN